MSRFGLYVFGYYIFMAAQFIMKSVFAASRLGEPSPLIPLTWWTVFAPMVIGISLEFVTAIMVSFLGGSDE